MSACGPRRGFGRISRAGSFGRAARFGRVGRRGTLVVAALFALALSIAPPAAHTALAAEPLRTEADATYTLDPRAGRVHVAIDVTETDLKPNTAQYVYYYFSFRFALQPEATNISVAGGSASSIRNRTRDGYIESTVTISKALFYPQSTSFTIKYDLVGAPPRSDIPTRVGAAFSTFAVWAWGDVGHSVVEVRTPNGFDASYQGDAMQVTSSATTGTILRASPDDPSSFFAIVTAENDDAYTETRMSLAGGVDIVVQSWPEDHLWTTTVTGTLRDAMPELRRLIGLDWPVAHDLGVRERYTPDLEGYAGFFLTDEQRIEVSEDLDTNVIVHEASHAWLNDALFTDRWIYEGLAEEYAWRAMTAAGLEPEALPGVPDLADPGWQALVDWRFPRVIRDQDTDDEERYGYAASFWVMHAVVEAVGVEQMRAAFAAAEANLTAYPGSSARETVKPADDWRRFLDLVEPLAKPDPPALEAAIGKYVTTTLEAQQVAKRAAARALYRGLVAAGDGWLPGLYVRAAMGDWAFDKATARMADATALIGLRGQVAAAAAALGLETGDALRAAYQTATVGFTDAMALGHAQLDALGAIAAAKAKVEATPDLVAQVGLLGQEPATAYAAARVAFEAGNLKAATSLAGTATSVVDGAPAAGQQRLIVAGLSVAGALVLLLLLVRVRQRRRARALAGAIEMAGATAAPPLADSTQPYATLAADPALEPPPPSAGPPDPEGGQGSG